MHSSLRAALGAVLATAVVLGVPVLSAAAPAGPSGRAAHAHRFTPAQATAIFDRLQAALAPKPAAERTAGAPTRDLSLLMRDAQLAKGSMTARQASIVDNSGRPVPASNGCADYDPLPLLQAAWVARASTHFCVHYRPDLSASSGGATLAQAQATLSTMEYVYAKEVQGLGYQPPLNDGDGKTDVFLDQIGDAGYYGFCTTEGSRLTSTAWCGLDNDFAEFGTAPISALRVTAAHEFFHAIQFGYDDNEDSWLMEGTAVWMEDQVYPTINDYLQYLPYSQIARPRNSLDVEASPYWYGAVTFWKFLSEHFRTPAIIRQVWNAARVSAGSRNAIQAVATVLRSHGTSLPPQFALYGVWNTLPPGTYSDRGRFPAPVAWASGTLTRRSHDTGVLLVKLNHLSTAPLVLRSSTTLPGRTRLRIGIDGPDTSHGTQARLQVRMRNGRVAIYTVSLNAAGNGSKTVAFNPRYVKSAIVTMSNGSSGYYDNQPFKVRARATY